MWTAAEGGKVTQCIKCHISVVKLFNQIELILIVAVFIKFESLFLRNGLRLLLFLLPRQLHHCVLILLNVILADSLIAEVYIIIKAIFHRRTNTKLSLWVEVLNGLSKQMGR